MLAWGVRLLCAALAALAGCTPSGSHVLIAVQCTDPIRMVDLFVRDDTDPAHKILLKETGWVPVDKGGMLDVSTTPYKIGLDLPHDGRYSFGAAGADGTTSATFPYIVDGSQFYWAATLDVSDRTAASAMLRRVPLGDDLDGDLVPDAAAWPAHQPMEDAPASLLDCQDKNPQKGVAPRSIGPFVQEVCGNGVDDDCDGADEPCVDSDGDGDPDSTDCKPNDPKVHHPDKNPMSPHFDPFPQSSNCCGYSLGKTGADFYKSFDGDPICHPRTCDDSVDEDCSGADVPCLADRDCDHSFAAPMQAKGCDAPPNPGGGGADCNDCDPNVNPNAQEICGNKIDDNCNGLVDETCVGCDLDGDGFQRKGGGNCPDASYTKAPDCDDDDAGVFPGSTDAAHPLNPKLLYVGGLPAQCGDREGGTVCGALRGTCRNGNPDGSPQDADCDGAARKGCPPAGCDADGDGFIDQAKAMQCDPNGALQPYDCDDADPQVFPNAPPQCGEKTAHNCAMVVPCGADGDGDGFDAQHDCDDTRASVHPFALEKCNGVDDDCDGLVDELNPDASGMRMVQNGKTLACNDSSVGDCAPTTGRCVCSAADDSGAHFDAASRVACPGETADVDTGAQKNAPAPRCYGAPQPSPEVCDGRDDDCDPATADGSFDCPGAGPPTCCGAGGCSQLADVMNCGGCNLACMLAHATPACVNLKCTVASCDAGFADCDMKAPNGCEVDTNNDPAHCGGCASACVVAHGTGGCAGGNCSIAGCTAPFRDCDMQYADGCEVNTGGDKFNCGACGTVCPTVTTDRCTNGSCTCGNNGPCDGTTRGCKFGNCLLLAGQLCSFNSDCLSNMCVKIQGVKTCK